jgi:uncharacterized RDD family membrane protein YckC
MDILFKKMAANFIDLIASLFIRLMILLLLISFYKESFLIEVNDFISKASTSEDARSNVMIFLQHNLFKILLGFIIGFSTLGSLYNIYFHSSTWCATIGQRICNIVVVRNNGEYVGFFRAVIHNIISNIPLFITLYFIVFIFFYSSKHPINSISVIFNVFSANIFNIFASIVMFLWVNIPIFLKNKKSIPDIICSTKTESGKADSRFPKIRIL